MTHVGRHFSLSTGSGVFCGEEGAFVGTVPLLERNRNASGLQEWQPRPLSELNRDLANYYGLPVEFNQKIGTLTSVSRALNRGDLLHAQITTLHLQIPDAPALTKSPESQTTIVYLAQQLRSSGLLKADWDPAKHPHWPAGTPGGIGGQFAPTGASDDTVGEEPAAQVIPAQIAIPAPLELPFPLPSEIAPGPLAPPDISPRDIPRNPYPDRPECEEEWADAFEYCSRLLRSGRMGKDGYRGMGKSFSQCLMGHVSEDCGGNITSRKL